MPRYEMQWYETHIRTFEVDAASPEEAIHKWLSEDPSLVDMGGMFLESDTDHGTSILSGPEPGSMAGELDFEELDALDVETEEWGVPGLHSIREISTGDKT